jgi:hypothetical protein
MAAALSDITGRVDNIALSGVLPASSGIPATVLADLAAADVRRAKDLFAYGASYPASTRYEGSYDPPRNIDLKNAIAVVDALFEHEKARFECKPGVYLEVAEAYGYYLADYFNRELTPAQRAFEIGKRAIKQSSTAVARAKQAAKAARKGQPPELRDGLAAAAREKVMAQLYEPASLFGAPQLPFLEFEVCYDVDAEGIRQLQPPPAAGPTVTTPVTDGATPHHAPIGGLEDMDATTLRFDEGAEPSGAQDEKERAAKATVEAWIAARHPWIAARQQARAARAAEEERWEAARIAEREASRAERERAMEQAVQDVSRAKQALAEHGVDRPFPEHLMAQYHELHVRYLELQGKIPHMVARASDSAYQMGVVMGREEALEEMEACGIAEEARSEVGARLEAREVVPYADFPLEEDADECSSDGSEV